MASILAKGFLRYRKTRQPRPPEPPQNDLVSEPEPSRHVTLVNTEGTDEN